MTESGIIAELRRDLERLRTEGEAFLRRNAAILADEDRKLSFNQPDYFWNRLPPEEQHKGVELGSFAVAVIGRIADVAKQALLVTDADQRDLSFLAKTLRATFRLRRYSHWDTSVLHDEGAVLGVQRAGQSEDDALIPSESERWFTDSLNRVASILELVVTSELSSPAEDASPRTVSRIRQDSAFIMMWMDPAHPELDDICDAVKQVFSSFGIQAIRADDIEHEGVITDRILTEIEGSEFLIADLTGARPSVYYEIGYAHALKKRVILYRKSGTQLHFDLAGYNCPEYENVRDLRSKLKRRLEQLTNKRPRAERSD